MKYNYVNQPIKYAWIILLIICSGTVLGQETEKKPRQVVNVTLQVVDETGNPIPEASIVIGEGIIHTNTDEKGVVTFSSNPNDYISIHARGFEKYTGTVSVAITQGSITLVRSKLFMTSDDDVELPFITVKKRNITGSTYVLNSDQLEKYPSTDIRNGLTGFGGVEIRENFGAPGINPQENTGLFGAQEKINVSSRGRTMTFVVDNVYTDITELPLDPGEIESVSIIKDIAGKTMFGPVGSDGIIYIKTKRGSPNERILTANFEKGIAVIDRMPQWASGADYARLNNQARQNSGFTTLPYSEYEIEQYAKNDPYDKVYPSINFMDMMLKDTRSFTRANLASRGGNDLVQYSAYLGYNGEGDIYKIGAQADYSRISTRSNIDIKLNDNIKLGFDFYGNLGIRRSPNYGWNVNFTNENTSTNTVLGLTELPDALVHMAAIPPVAFPVYANYDSISMTPWYGVTTAYGINPIGNLEGNGYYKDQGRQGSANVILDYDMKGLLKGLKSKTFLGFNTYNLVRIGKVEDYIAYIAKPGVSPVTGNDTLPVTLTKVHLGVDQANMAKLMDYYFQRYAFFQNISFDRSFGKSHLAASATYYYYKTFKNEREEPERMQNGILTGIYSLDDKYTLSAVLNYSGTYSFADGKRYKLFPAIGASWVVSAENFMNNVKFLDFLKLRAEYGTIGMENFRSPYLYRDNWSYNSTGNAFGAHSSNQWFGSGTDANVQRAWPSRIGNPNLSWELSQELSAGLDALLMAGKLSLEVTYFNTVVKGQIVQLQNSLPFVLGLSGARPYANYNDTKFDGVESIIHYTDRIGSFSFSIGGSASTQRSERLKYDEPDYRFNYQSRVGKPADAIYGLQYLGKFENDEEALIVPQLFDAVLKEGDLKYADMNSDGVVDDNDATMIGHGYPKLIYSVDADLRYRNFGLSLVGAGRAFFDVGFTSIYFMNGWGDNNYSEFVKNNIGGAYPRLTYYRVNNNFQMSDFWLRKGDFFKIQAVELSYNLPSGITSLIGSRGVKVYLRGANLYTFSDIKEVDPEATTSGVYNYPLYRTFTGGIKLIF